MEAEHQKFTVNTQCASGRVFGHHSKYQIADFLRNPSSAKHPAGSGDQTPVECESRSVPTQNGLRTHHNESLFPPDQNLRARTQNRLSNADSLGLGLRFSVVSC